MLMQNAGEDLYVKTSIGISSVSKHMSLPGGSREWTVVSSGSSGLQRLRKLIQNSHILNGHLFEGDWTQRDSVMVTILAGMKLN